MRATRLLPGLFIVSWGVLCGCGPSQSQTHGSATYAGSSSQGGKAVPPQQNQSDLQLSVSIVGTGAFQAAQGLACSLTNGDLTESTSTSGQVSSGGNYQGSFGLQQSGSAWTNSVCGTVQNAKLSSVTSVTVKGTIPASQNCQGYCDAYASVQCQSSTDTSCVSNTTASCTTQCQGSQKISAQGSLQQSDMAATNNQLASSGQVDAQVDLVFDTLE